MGEMTTTKKARGFKVQYKEKVQTIKHGYVGIVYKKHHKCPESQDWIDNQAIPVDPASIYKKWYTILVDGGGAVTVEESDLLSVLMSKYTAIFDAVDERFPDAQFSVSCFKSIEEIETKVLNDTDDYIIYTDTYEIIHLNRKNRHADKKYKDYFIVKKRENKDAIYYCDVIDELIRNKFDRNDCDHRFLESIRLVESLTRNNNSIKIYGSFWGS